MKSLIILVGFLAAINLATCYLSDEGGSMSSSRYIEYLRQRRQIEAFRRQLASVCPGKDEELDEALIQLKECSDQIDENTETACSAIKNHFLRCSKPFIKLLEECMPEQSKEIPSLIFNSVNSGVAYLCKTDGEHIFELANTCVFKTNYRSLRCERRVKTKLQQYKNKPPTKSEFCELALSLKPCLHNHLQDSCGNRITKETFMGMFDALTTPCNLSINPNNQWRETNALNEVEILE